MKDAATGNEKLITELSGKTQFLMHQWDCCPGHHTTAKGGKFELKKKVSKSAVSKVKEDNNLKQLLQMVLRAVS